MPELLALEAKLDLQQLKFSSNVGKAYNKTSALATEASSEMANGAASANANADKYIKISSALGILGGALGGLGMALTGISFFIEPEAMLNEELKPTTLKQKFAQGVVRSLDGLSLGLSVFGPLLPKAYSSWANYQIAKDKATIQETSGVATQASSTNGELTKMVQSATKLQANLARSMAEIISAYKQAEI